MEKLKKKKIKPLDFSDILDFDYHDLEANRLGRMSLHQQNNIKGDLFRTSNNMWTILLLTVALVVVLIFLDQMQPLARVLIAGTLLGFNGLLVWGEYQQRHAYWLDLKEGEVAFASGPLSWWRQQNYGNRPHHPKTYWLNVGHKQFTISPTTYRLLQDKQPTSGTVYYLPNTQHILSFDARVEM